VSGATAVKAVRARRRQNINQVRRRNEACLEAQHRVLATASHRESPIRGVPKMQEDDACHRRIRADRESCVPVDVADRNEEYGFEVETAESRGIKRQHEKLHDRIDRERQRNIDASIRRASSLSMTSRAQTARLLAIGNGDLACKTYSAGGAARRSLDSLRPRYSLGSVAEQRPNCQVEERQQHRTVSLRPASRNKLKPVRAYNEDDCTFQVSFAA
jgi:hypothetical protein